MNRVVQRMEKIRVRGKNYIVVLAILLIFAISLMTAIKPAKAAYVKFYVYQPLGYIPFATPGVKQAVNITIMVETSGMDDWADPNNGIVGWGVNLQVDPNVLNIDRTAPPPPPPGQLAPAKAEGGKPNFFLYTYASWYGLTSNLLAGSSDPTTGYWKDIAETIMPTPTHGAGDYTSANYPKVVTLYVTAKSDTQPCLIDIVSAYYKTPTGVYPVEIIVDGYYGTPPPRTMSYQGSLLPPGDPTGTPWHEIYPNYCTNWQLVWWGDNGDGDLTASDQIDMVDDAGWTYHFHVDQVTVTIHWTFKAPDEGPADAEPYLPTESPITDPIGTTWHQIYPPEDYCKEFVITSWEDNGDGVFSESDQFDFEYFGEGIIHWAHLDDITTDIILSQKGEPEPPMPEFPLGVAVEVGLIVAVAYIWWTRRRKIQKVL